LQDELLELQAGLHKTIVFITHDLDEALKLGDRIAIMKDGAVVQIGTAEEILTEPADDYVKAFVENVDRSKVITAGTIMKKTEAIIYEDDGPHVASRKMRQLGLSTLFVVDTDRRYLGYVHIDDTVAMEKRMTEEKRKPADAAVREIVKTDGLTTKVQTPIVDLLNDASQRAIPFAVVDEENRLKGIVTRPAILAGIAGD